MNKDKMIPPNKKVYTGILIAVVLLSAMLLTNKKPQVCFASACVDIEVVSKKEDLKRGLGGRESLKEGTGMLFVFDKPGRHKFWMKDMKFPLDIIWLDKENKVMYIATSMPPCTDDKDCPGFGPQEDAAYVLEVNAGFSNQKQIIAGAQATLKNITK